MVRPGLAQVTDNRCVLADARELPFKNAFFDAIITEPPFNTRYRQSVLDSLPELCRVMKPCGKMVLLIAQDMYSEIMAYMIGYGFNIKKDFTIRRHGGLTSRVLVFQQPKMEEK